MTLTAPADTPTAPSPRICKRCGREISGDNCKSNGAAAARAKGRRFVDSCRACYNDRNWNRRRQMALNDEFRSLDDDPRDAIRLTNPIYAPLYREPLSDEQGATPMAINTGNGKNAPWNLYKVRPEAREIWQQFQYALDETRTPCHENPEAFTEYDDPRYEDDRRDRDMPTPIEAALLCRECPLLDLCGEYAEAERPDWGVYGGKVWLSGKPVTRGASSRIA